MAENLHIGDQRQAGEEGPAGDMRQTSEAGPAGDPRPAGVATLDANQSSGASDVKPDSGNHLAVDEPVVDLKPKAGRTRKS